MSNQNNGGPAFPRSTASGQWGNASEGMTLRDYFAAKAMQGMIASGITTDIDGEYVFQQRAKMAYVVADAMIAERDK